MVSNLNVNPVSFNGSLKTVVKELVTLSAEQKRARCLKGVAHETVTRYPDLTEFAKMFQLKLDNLSRYVDSIGQDVVLTVKETYKKTDRSKNKSICLVIEGEKKKPLSLSDKISQKFVDEALLKLQSEVNPKKNRGFLPTQLNLLF